MRSTVRRQAVAVLVAAMAAAPAVGIAQTQPAWQSATAAPSADELTRRDLDQQLATLTDTGNVTPSQRDEAARRLVARQTPLSRAYIDQVLGNATNSRGQLAIARAVADDPNPDPALIDRLADLLGADRLMTDAAAQALANYKSNPQAVDRLTQFARHAPGVADLRQRDAVRAVTIAALGNIPDKRVVESLITFISAPGNSPTIRNASADALVEMTGLRQNGHDPVLWIRWWDQNRERSDADFRMMLLTNKGARADKYRRRLSELTEELATLLTQQYQASSTAARQSLLLQYLRSGQPIVRLIGARIVQDDQLNGEAPTAETADVLRKLVGDSDPDVRLQVAATIRDINDPGALDPLLAQATVERDPAVQIAIAGALGQLRDSRAVPVLLPLLDDPNSAVARAAADALHRTSVNLRSTNPALATRTAERLRALLEGRAAIAGADQLRAAVVTAMAPLREPALLQVLLGLLNSRESAPVREAALEALGSLRDTRSSDKIASWIREEDDANVRLKAVHALGRTGNVAFIDELFDRTQQRVEPDQRIRQEAWTQIQSLLPMASVEQLNAWLGRFPEGNPDVAGRRLDVLLAMLDKQLEQRQFDQLAYTQQNIGATYLDGLDDPGRAVPRFRAARQYWKQNGQQGQTMILVEKQLLTSLLKARQYEELGQFSAELLQQDPGNQQMVAPAVRAELERLRDAGELDDAMKLITTMDRMPVKFASRFAEDLSRLRQDVERSIEARDSRRPKSYRYGWEQNLPRPHLADLT